MKKLLFAIFVVTTIISFTSCRNKKEQDKAKQQVEKVKENVNDAVDKVSDKIEECKCNTHNLRIVSQKRRSKQRRENQERNQGRI